jgi:hypothetical protein
MRFFLPACAFLALCCAAETPRQPPAAEVLALYRTQSETSDPGADESLYAGLPREERRLCELIKAQLIHPFDLVREPGFRREDFRFEDLEFPTVATMLAELRRRGPGTLDPRRTVAERLAVACWHHGVLCASMLRHLGVPVRMRAGFARYIGSDSGLHVGHVICEVWDAARGEWFLVDADREKIDFKRREFEFAPEAWAALRRGDDVDRYHSAHYVGLPAIAHLLMLDMRMALGREAPYWYDPPVVAACESGLEALSVDEIAVLDRIAECLLSIDTSLDTLRAIRAAHAFLEEVDHSEELREHIPG